MVEWKNGTLVSPAHVNEDGTITPAVYEGDTPLSAYNLNLMQQEFYDTLDEIKQKSLLCLQQIETPTPEVGENITLNDSKAGKFKSFEIEGNSKRDVTKVVPEEYEQLDYIEGTGTQYIETTSYVTPNTKIEADIQFVDTTTTQQMITRTESEFIFGFYVNGSKKFAYSANDDTGNFNSTNIAVDNKRHCLILDSYNGTWKVDNTSGNIISTSRTKTSDCKMLLFNLSKGPTSTPGSNASRAKMKMFGFKVYEANVLKRNYVPCKRKSDNKIGLFDTVNKVFYSNAGTGEFVEGNAFDVPTPENKIDIKSCGENENITIIIDNNKDKTASTYKSQNKIVPTQKTFRSIGDIRDHFIKQGGKYYEKHLVDRYIFKGTETVSLENSAKRIYIRFSTNNLTNPPKQFSNDKQKYGLLCNYLQEVTAYETWQGVQGISYATNSNITATTNGFCIAINEFTTVDEYKNWFSQKYAAGNPFYVDYILAEPELIECTAAQTAILQDIEDNLETYDDVTHIYSTDEVAPNMSATYCKDIEKLFNNIAI